MNNLKIDAEEWKLDSQSQLRIFRNIKRIFSFDNLKKTKRQNYND